MKKILIISYFFPPSNFAGSYRIASWAKYLHKFGYYPVIITRCWNDNQIETTDELKSNQFSHEKFDTYEVYRLPYHNTLRDRLHSRYGDSRFRLFRKLLTLIELIFQNYINAIIPYSNLLSFSKELIRKEKDFCGVLVSGRPFQLFKFGSALHRDTGIKWIADYRDEWHTDSWTRAHSLTYMQKFIFDLESKMEKKWLRNASLFTTCSEDWVGSIGSFVGRSGRVVLNGYDDSGMIASRATGNTETFNIVHNGSLYHAQPIEIFLDAYKEFIDQHRGAKVTLRFPGIEYMPEETKRVKEYMLGYERYFSTSKRIPKPELLSVIADAHLLLMVGTVGVKGHHSSKIFEYLISGKPILMCPDDKDVMGELIQETRTGTIVNTKEEVLKYLNECYADFLAGKAIAYAPDMEAIKFYSREKQTEILAGILNEVF